MSLLYNKKIKIAVIMLFLVLISSLFYWFQIRPTKIMHACSWTKTTLAPIPASPGITQEEADTRSLENYKQCLANKIPTSIFKFDCNEHSVAYKAPTPAQPEKDIWKPATKDEYAFCLHDKGLK